MTGTKIAFWFISITGIIISFSSCTCDKSDKSNQTVISTDTSAISLFDSESVMYLIPSPGEILDRFHEADIEFNQEYLNPLSNKDSYFGSMSQSLNLGVYIADMAYLSMFERNTESVKYLETIQSLSYDVGIASSVFESLITRAKANAGVIDSLYNISNEAFTDLLEFLEEGGKENTIALISAGAYIESLYLALQSAGDYSEGNKSLELISEMMFPLYNILERAKYARDDENVESIINVLDRIGEIFNELETKDPAITLSENEKGVISILGDVNLTMNKEEFLELKSRVTEIRNNVVSN